MEIKQMGHLEDSLCGTFLNTPQNPSQALTLGADDIWGRITLCGGDCPVHCGMFSRTPGFCPLSVSSTPPPSCDNQNCFQTFPNVSGRQGSKIPPG